MMFEVLNRLLVSLRSFLCAECAEVAPMAGFGIFLARVQSVLPGFQFSNHRKPRKAWMLGEKGG